MGDFDWYGTCGAVVATGNCSHCLAGDTAGNIFSSAPLQEDGNYAFWVYGDPYKATITKEVDAKGTTEDVEEDIYEAYNLSLLLTDQKASIPQGHGIRVMGTKYMLLQSDKNKTYTAKVNDESFNVTFEQTHVLKKGSEGIFIAVKGGYFMAAKCDTGKPEQQGALAFNALAVGLYWATGADA